MTQHTSSGTGDKAELHLVRAVNTGIINVKPNFSFKIIHFTEQLSKLSLGVQESAEKIERSRQNVKKLQKKKPPVEDAKENDDPSKV